MTGDAKTLKAGPKSLGSELIIPAIAFFFTLYYFYTIMDAPWTAQVAAFIVGSILILLVVSFVIKTLKSLSNGEGVLGFENLVKPRFLLRKRAILLVLTIAFIMAVPALGFTITTFVFIATAMLVLSDFEKKCFIIFLAITLSVGGYLLFIVAFETRFPEGPFEIFVKGFF
jgi:hypothetical protein